MTQLDLFTEPVAETVEAGDFPAPGFTQDELSALRVARLVSAVRAIGYEEMYAARDAIKKWRVEAKSSPVFEFLHGKLNYARGLLQEVTV